MTDQKNRTLSVFLTAFFIVLLSALIAAGIVLYSVFSPFVADVDADPTQEPAPPPAPAAVTGLCAVIDESGVHISWDANDGASGYTVTVSDGDSGVLREESCTKTSINLTGLYKTMGCSVSVSAFRSTVTGTVYGASCEPVQLAPGIEALPEDTEFLIRVSKNDNCVTVYYSDDGEWVPLTAFICSCGSSTPVGKFTLSSKWRWLWMVDDSYGQWVSQISGNYLFHSVPYWGTKNPEMLDVDEYNKLGTTASHGCVRLIAGDAKFIYDNVPSGTKIEIYADDSGPGPLGKPPVETLPEWHTWDPTDPDMRDKCAEKGCH